MQKRSREASLNYKRGTENYIKSGEKRSDQKSKIIQDYESDIKRLNARLERLKALEEKWAFCNQCGARIADQILETYKSLSDCKNELEQILRDGFARTAKVKLSYLVNSSFVLASKDRWPCASPLKAPRLSAIQEVRE